MADLTVEVCGLKFRNPVIPAAGPNVRDAERVIESVRGGCGAALSKTISVDAAPVPMPHMAEVRGGFINTELWSELPPERWFEREFPLCRQAADEAGIPLICSLGYTGQEIAQLAPRMNRWAHALELSTHYLGEDPTPMIEAIDAAKQGFHGPVWVKMSPLGREMRAAAQAAKDAGADGLVATNSFGPTMGFDVETGYPLLGGENGYGWLSGPALKPLSLRCVYDIVAAVDLPVIGVGGISRGEDAIEFVMAGAVAVGICTAAIMRGNHAYGEVARQMDQWLDAHGYASINDIRGLAHRGGRSEPRS
jgi:dihydroorotate dehydrogenase (NAD+) catalytic subunit